MTENKEIKRKSFVLYTSYANQIEKLSVEEKGMLLDAIFTYQISGEVMSGMTPFVDIIFSFMKTQFDIDRTKYEDKCERLEKNKRKSSRNQTEISRNQTEICRNQTDICRNHTDISSDNNNVNVNVNDNVNVNVNVNKNENENENFNDYVYDYDTLSYECVETPACGGGESAGEAEAKEKEVLKSFEESFEEFFEEYPRKQGKRDALSTWKKIKPDRALRDKIMRGLRRACSREEWLRDNGRFVPMASTWLEGYRWEDEDTALPRGRPNNMSVSSAHDQNAAKKEPSYGDVEEFFELALKRSYEKLYAQTG